MSPEFPRRTFLGLAAAGGAALVEAACGGGTQERKSKLAPAKHPELIRVSTVFTPYSSGLLPALAQSFQAANPSLHVKLEPANDVFTPAIKGDADLVIVHYYHLGQPTRQPGRVHAKKKGIVPGSGQGGGIPGSGLGPGSGGSGGGGGSGPGSGTGGGTGGGRGTGPGSGTGRGRGTGPGAGNGRGPGTGPVASASLLPGNMTYPNGASPGTMTTGAFVLEGFGLWPMAVFTNQALLVGPPSDPAGVKRLASASQAVRRIAARGHKFVVAALDVRIYFLDQLLVAASGARPGDWYVRSTNVGTALLEEAASLHAYTVWGDETASLKVVKGRLEPLVTADPVMQRTMVSIVVNPHAVAGVNAPGARSFQEYLTTPAAQATILAFREPGFASPTFWPAAATSA